MNFTDFRVDLESYKRDKIVFIGLGNILRGDDAAGLKFLGMIRQSGQFPGAHFISAGTNPENYLMHVLEKDPQVVIFLDACNFQGKPGEMRWLLPDEIDSAGISTHAYSVSLIEKYLNINRNITCRYFAIQPASVKMKKEMSEEVLQSMQDFFTG